MPYLPLLPLLPQISDFRRLNRLGKAGFDVSSVVPPAVFTAMREIPRPRGAEPRMQYLKRVPIGGPAVSYSVRPRRFVRSAEYPPVRAWLRTAMPGDHRGRESASRRPAEVRIAPHGDASGFGMSSLRPDNPRRAVNQLLAPESKIAISTTRRRVPDTGGLSRTHGTHRTTDDAGCCRHAPRAPRHRHRRGRRREYLLLG